MSYAETLTPQQRKKYEKHAIFSTWFGCISEQMIDSNALIVLYIVMLGGNDSISMFSTSLSSVASVVLMIFCAGLAVKFGLRMTYSAACIVGSLAFLAIAAAPYAGSYAQNIVIGSAFIYSLTRPVYSSTWYPLLDNFLLPEGRSKFFGKMRFSYMILNTILIYAMGKIMGAKPPVLVVQSLFVFGGLMLMGRKFEMDRMPLNPNAKREPVNIPLALGICIKNGPLIGFSIYSCLVNMAFYAAVPLAVVYMKTCLNFNAESLMTFSSVGLLGSIVGYAAVGRLLPKFKTKKCLIGTHLTGLLVCILLLTAVPQNPLLKPILYVTFFLNGFVSAFMLCINSIEMLALARPGNKVMAMAFVATITNLGTAVGRLGTTLILWTGALAASWNFAGMTMTKFQFLFGFYTFAMIFFLILLPLAPAVIPRHHDYYHP
ncbi:MAG: MFS transporter [Lentisphaeria bacterium]|nr:MFS transporter [Lentisphaeria bacterium]